MNISEDNSVWSNLDANASNLNSSVIFDGISDEMFAVIAVITGFLIMCNNFLVIVVIYNQPSMCEAPHRIAISLAVADIGMGVYLAFLFPSGVLTEVPREFCMFGIYIANSFSKSSYTHLSLIALDRYLAITQPLRYYSIVTSDRLKAVMAFTWVFSFAISVSVFVADRWTPGNACYYEFLVGTGAIYFGFSYFLSNVLVMMLAYSSLMGIARRHGRRVNSECSSEHLMVLQLKLTKVTCL